MNTKTKYRITNTLCTFLIFASAGFGIISHVESSKPLRGLSELSMMLGLIFLYISTCLQVRLNKEKRQRRTESGILKEE